MPGLRTVKPLLISPCATATLRLSNSSGKPEGRAPLHPRHRLRRRSRPDLSGLPWNAAFHCSSEAMLRSTEGPWRTTGPHLVGFVFGVYLMVCGFIPRRRQGCRPTGGFESSKPASKRGIWRTLPWFNVHGASSRSYPQCRRMALKHRAHDQFLR